MCLPSVIALLLFTTRRCLGRACVWGQQSPLGKQPWPMTWVTLRHTHTHFQPHPFLTTSHFRSIWCKQRPICPKQTFPAWFVCVYSIVWRGRHMSHFQGWSTMPLGLFFRQQWERSIIAVFDTVCLDFTLWSQISCLVVGKKADFSNMQRWA